MKLIDIEFLIEHRFMKMIDDRVSFGTDRNLPRFGPRAVFLLFYYCTSIKKFIENDKIKFPWTS